MENYKLFESRIFLNDARITYGGW